jgi:hypothetical protein
VGPFNALSGWLLYFAPTLIAWYRSKNGKPIEGTVGRIGLFNFLIGWTVVGWFLMLAEAFGYNPVAWFVLKFAKQLTTSGPAPTFPQGGQPAGSPGTVACGQCGGSGSMMCSTCNGRGSWYTQPSGASGSSQLQTCPACTSSGRLRCPYCGGSGRLAGGIA